MFFTSLKRYEKDKHLYTYKGFMFEISKDVEYNLRHVWGIDFFEEIKKKIDWYLINGDYSFEENVKSKNGIVGTQKIHIDIDDKTIHSYFLYSKTNLPPVSIKKQPTCYCAVTGEPNYSPVVCNTCDAELEQSVKNEVEHEKMDNARMKWDEKVDRIEGSVQSKAEWEVRRAIFEMNSDRNDGWVKEGYRDILQKIRVLLDEFLK